MTIHICINLINTYLQTKIFKVFLYDNLNYIMQTIVCVDLRLYSMDIKRQSRLYVYLQLRCQIIVCTY